MQFSCYTASRAQLLHCNVPLSSGTVKTKRALVGAIKNENRKINKQKYKQQDIHKIDEWTQKEKNRQGEKQKNLHDLSKELVAKISLPPQTLTSRLKTDKPD